MNITSKKITATLTSTVLAFSAMAVPSMSSSAGFLSQKFGDEYTYTNGNGLFDNNPDNGWELYYKEKSLSTDELLTPKDDMYPHFYINYIAHYYNAYAFEFKKSSDSKTQFETALNILTKYYGEFKDGSTSGNKEYTNEKAEIRYYTDDINTCIVSIEKTTLEADKKISNDVMKDLNQADIISSFYDIGQYGFSSYIDYYPLFYSGNSDVETIQKYLDDNKLNFTAEKASDIEDVDFIIKPDSESISVTESLEIAKKLNSELKIKPYAVIAESASRSAGKNSLSDLSSETEPTSDNVSAIGDLNGDKTIDSKDAVIILKTYAENLANKKTSDKADPVADINKDGQVDSKDAVIVLRYYASKLAKTFDGNITDFK